MSDNNYQELITEVSKRQKRIKRMNFGRRIPTSSEIVEKIKEKGLYTDNVKNAAEGTIKKGMKKGYKYALAGGGAAAAAGLGYAAYKHYKNKKSEKKNVSESFIEDYLVD